MMNRNRMNDIQGSMPAPPASQPNALRFNAGEKTIGKGYVPISSEDFARPS
jgi:hypothetical protein